MQINSVHGFPASQLEDFNGNLDAAKNVSKGWKDFSPWFSSGGVPTAADKKKTADAINGGKNGDNIIGNPNAGVDPITKAVNGTVNSVGDFLGKITDPNIWLQVGKVILGGALIILAVGGTIYVVSKPRLP